MHVRRTRTLGLAATVALAIATLGGPTASAGGTDTIMVDGDGRATAASCSAGGAGSASTTIQDGIEASGPGDTVLVCPGTYIEQVYITDRDGLTVRSTRPWKATIQAPNQIDAPFIAGIYGADRVTFQWFTVVTRPTDGCDQPAFGILAFAGRDLSIRSNRVRNLGRSFGPCAFGIGISAGYPLTLGTSKAAFPAGGAPDDLTTTASVRFNAVRDHTLMGIGVFSTYAPTAGGAYGPTRADILDNSIRFYHTDVTSGECPESTASLSSRDARPVRRSLAALPAGLGFVCESIGIYQGAAFPESPIGPAGTIRGNRISSGPNAVSEFTAGAEPGTPAQLFGILVLDQRHAAGASQVIDNLVVRNVFGIAAVDAGGVEIRDNRVLTDFFGISVWDTEGAVVRDNVTRYGIVGIFSDDEPFFDGTPQPWYVTDDVRFRDNDARQNGEASCVDQTLGDGTLGTDNTWTGNLGELDSSEPAGICGGVTPP